ncbi:Serine--tRNA ligase, mitochondrial [Myotisia sp. PD_48]|nr:Serine--tRNA ligase, mitochondrial [Myotisia sp. PD_48]
MSPSSPYICLCCRLAVRSQPRISPYRNFSIYHPLRSLPSSPPSRPPTAPKPVPNVKHIRENADQYSKNCIDRNYRFAADYPSRIQSLAKEASHIQHALKEPRSRIKNIENDIAKLARALAQLEKQGDSSKERPSEEKPIADVDFQSLEDPDTVEQLDALRVEAKRLKDESQQMVDRREECMLEIQNLALSLPNLTSGETPIGSEPRVVGYINYDPKNSPSYTMASPTGPSSAPSHVAIGTELGLIDFTSSATSTGWGWYFLTNEGCLLEHALVQYALTVARQKGWKPVSPPSVVYSHIAEACGFQPRDVNNEQQIWTIQQTERDKAANKPQRSLTGTAEIPLAAMYANQEIQAEQLPIKLVGASRCYRAEAGARGVDTKGLYRVHEFTKVEMFAWADNYADSSFTLNPSSPTTIKKRAKDGGDKPEAKITSISIFSEMLSIQTEILSSLNLPCRILEMPSSDLGASAARKRDIEVLFPSRINMSTQETGDSSTPCTTTISSDVFSSGGDSNGWGEVTSTSICTDYQSRRLGTRLRGGHERTGSRFPDTVNGTAMAVPRVLAAILEHGWDEKLRGVVVPEVLRPFMGGIELIRKQA